MKRENLLVTVAAGIGFAALAYYLLSKDDIKEEDVVQQFDANQYMGLWHEIARMPSAIEKNIAQLTEDYSINEDGAMTVVTRGYNTKKGEWKEAAGKIKFAGAQDVGKLKVSYFGPFYADYNVLDITPDSQHALVSGSGTGYLWIL